MNDPKNQDEPSMEEILASIRRIISEDGQPVAEPDDGASSDKTDQEDVLELTQVVEEGAGPGSAARTPSPTAIDERTDRPAEPASRMGEGRIESAPSAAVPERSGGDRPEPAPRPADDPDSLVSAGAATAGTAAFASLANALQVQRSRPGDITIGAGERTLEDIVRELLRPMLKEWLDANLPQTVERLVRREIERLARRAE